MKLEDRLTEALGRQVDEIDVPPGDYRNAVAQGRAQRRRRWAGAALFAAVLALGIVIPISQLGSKSGLDPAIKPWGTWTEIAPAPLSPRVGTIATWTGEEAMLWGGFASPLTCGFITCSSPASASREGVAYNPTDKTWRQLAKAPFEVSSDLSHKQIDDHLLVQSAQQEWWSFAASANEWERLRDAPETMVSPSLSALGQELYAVGNGLGDRVNVYDLVSGSWSSLPVSQHSPRLGDRFLVATEQGVLAVGRVYGESIDGYTPVFRAEFFDGQQWVRLAERVPSRDSCCWEWIGKRLVIPDDAQSVSASLEQLGLSTASLAGLPATEDPERWTPDAMGGPLLARNGVIYDDRDESWSRVDRPVGAPDPTGAASWVDGQLMVVESLEPREADQYVERSTSRVWVYTARK